MLWRQRIEGLKPLAFGQNAMPNTTPDARPWEAPPGQGAKLVEECETWLKAHIARLGAKACVEAYKEASTLPSDYRSYLQEVPLSAEFWEDDVVFAVDPLPGLPDGRDTLASLFGWAFSRGNELIHENEVYNADYKGSHDSDVFDDYFIIGASYSDFPVLLKLTQPCQGSIALWDRYSNMPDGSDKSNVYAIVDTFSAFIDSLQKKPGGI